MLSLISIHVPKTAGTNFTETLKLIYGKRIHKDYGTERDLVKARTCAPEILADAETFRSQFDVIHGHFHYLKYKPVFPEVPVLVTLRHPVARVISQYRHIALHGDPNNKRHNMIMNGEMDVVTFSSIRFIGNAQSVFLEGIDVDDVAHAIIQEHFAPTVERFCASVGFNPKDSRVQKLVAKPINSREKSAWNTKAVPVDPSVHDQIEKHCGADIEIYNRAVERFVQ